MILPLFELVGCFLKFLRLVFDDSERQRKLLLNVIYVFSSHVQFFEEGLLVFFETLNLEIHVVYLDLD